MTNKSDFDFLIGNWRVINKRLKERLVENNDWEEFEASLKVWKILDGFANVDEYKTEINGKPFYASTTRVFNPTKNEWSIFWLDTSSYELLPQVKGTFNENGYGEFYGEELFNGKMTMLRFEWKSINNNSAHWNQAYFDEANNEWEINWTMQFIRKEN